MPSGSVPKICVLLLASMNRGNDAFKESCERGDVWAEQDEDGRELWYSNEKSRRALLVRYHVIRLIARLRATRNKIALEITRWAKKEYDRSKIRGFKDSSAVDKGKKALTKSETLDLVKVYKDS